MRKPNFFIVGAPKCGTTALYSYLRDHPNIFMPTIKEPNYFANDLHAVSSAKYKYKMTLKEYLALYSDCPGEMILAGDASPLYLYSSVALKNIWSFDSNAKIIAMFRNPVDMAYSFHSHLLRFLIEDQVDFEKSFYLQQARQEGVSIPTYCKEPAFLQYSKIALFGDQAENVLKVFNPNQVKFILFDDFISSTKTIYEDTLSFLGVSSDGRTDFPVINENSAYRSYLLSRLLGSHYFIKARNYIKARLNLKTEGISKIIRKLNTKHICREPLSHEFRSELIKVFSEDIDKLSRILGRDLGHWKKVK